MKISMKKLAVAFGATLLALFSISTAALAEGSINLNQSNNRAYTEWGPGSKTAGIERTTILQVYAKSGETIYFGSSVAASADSKDIVVTAPDKSVTVLDVDAKTKEGLISTRKMEENGPNFDGTNTDGYTPIAFEVSQTGIYSVEFHAESTKVGPGYDPKPQKVDAEFLAAQARTATVAAWDISVVSDGEIKTGRTFTYCVALNTGVNRISMGAKVYVLTKDGYEYCIDLTGMDPYGFLLYANNRGFIDSADNSSLYKTAVAENNDLNFAQGVKALNPNDPDTTTTVTHRIFFNHPADDLPSDIPTTPEAGAAVKSVAFTGVEDNVTTVSAGGVFTVEVSKMCTAAILIDIDGNGEYTPDVDAYITEALAKGTNKIIWDGKNDAGEPVAAGDYPYYVQTRSGEYHFPLLDVENNNSGLKIQLVNSPDLSVDDDDSWLVYYDLRSYETVAGPVVIPVNNTLNPTNAVAGVSSKKGALKFGNAFGDYKGFDVWTYSNGEKLQGAKELVVVDAAATTGTVAGKVFYDTNKDGVFDITESGMENVTVKITTSTGEVITTTTDSAGSYTAVVPIGEYTVEIIYPNGYDMTTGSNVYTGEVTLAKNNVTVSNSGYVYDVNVAIDVDVDADADFEIDTDVLYTVTIRNTTNFPIRGIVSRFALPAGNAYISDSSNGNYNHESGAITFDALDANASYTFTVKATLTQLGTFTAVGDTTCEGDSIEADNEASVKYTVVKPLVENATCVRYTLKDGSFTPGTMDYETLRPHSYTEYENKSNDKESVMATFSDVWYTVLTEGSFVANENNVPQSLKDAAVIVADIVEARINELSKTMQWEYGRVDSQAWKASYINRNGMTLGVTPFISATLEARGVTRDKYVWLARGDRMGNIIEVFVMDRKLADVKDLVDGEDDEDEVIVKKATTPEDFEEVEETPEEITEDEVVE